MSKISSPKKGVVEFYPYLTVKNWPFCDFLLLQPQSLYQHPEAIFEKIVEKAHTYF